MNPELERLLDSIVAGGLTARWWAERGDDDAVARQLRMIARDIADVQRAWSCTKED